MADGRFVTLTEVRHVPNLRKNLISIGMLDSKGFSFDISGGTLRVSKKNKEMLEKSGQGKQPLHRGTQSKRRDTSGATSAGCPQRSSKEGDQVDFEKLHSEGRSDAKRTPMRSAGHLGEKVQALRYEGAYTSVGSGIACW
ncbi:hypothetical protein Acr_20g0006930 [Actinidia rufa]|uniref:Retrovirus-related Pol polyprotein from transposon TNT 1-94-like beta-barrel domain-containing protein n=1 Tax=Actinidia rufa TaxID=165716 RepID=A0A7J0GDQ5_9ERIC|nr:hypothetical protein Acr_20g0006930 [Actinidia rufa]